MCFVFFFNDTATTEIYTLSLHDALPICGCLHVRGPLDDGVLDEIGRDLDDDGVALDGASDAEGDARVGRQRERRRVGAELGDLHRRPQQLLTVGSSPTLTTSLPKFLPRKRPMNASGAFSRPTTTSSRYRSLPSRSHAEQSRWKSAKRSACSETMKPRMSARLTRSGDGFGPGGGSAALYCEIRPQSGMRANGLMSRRTAARTSPPTLSK